MGDYDGAADRISEYVPPEHTSQSAIADYIDREVTVDPKNAIDRKERFVDEISDRIADSREGVSTEGGRKFLDLGSGQWKDEGGLFTSPPDGDGDG